MKYKFNPLTGEFNLVPDSGTLKQKLNWLTGNFNLTKDAGKYKQIYNVIEGEFNLRPAVTQVVVHGVGSIQLTNAVENGLLSLTAYGGTEQNGTPTPTTPVDIVCNNGTIKFSKNMVNVNSQTVLVGYYISAQGQVLESSYNRIYQEYIPCKPNTKYTISMSNAIYYISISEYSTAEDSGFVRRSAGSTSGNTQFTIKTRSNTNYLRFGANLSASDITIDDVLAINWQLEEGDTPTQYKPYVEGGVYVEGITETIEDELGNTATAEMLLKVGDYADEQEILSGNIIRKVGYKIFDGTENFSTSTTYGKACLVQSAASGWGAVKYNVLCTHFEGLPQTSGNQPDYTCFFNASGHFYFRLEDNTVATFKQWLADQYAAGTPVIVFFALSTETTESVAGQAMNIPKGNSTIEITQASLDNLELEATYEQEA